MVLDSRELFAESCSGEGVCEEEFCASLSPWAPSSAKGDVGTGVAMGEAGCGARSGR